jgi:hypothetical protein
MKRVKEDRLGIQRIDAGLDGSHMRQIRDQGGIPTGCSGQRKRKDGAEAVDDVGSKKQRDMQARVVNGSVLKMVGKRRRE